MLRNSYSDGLRFLFLSNTFHFYKELSVIKAKLILASVSLLLEIPMRRPSLRVVPVALNRLSLLGLWFKQIIIKVRFQWPFMSAVSLLIRIEIFILTPTRWMTTAPSNSFEKLLFLVDLLKVTFRLLIHEPSFLMIIIIRMLFLRVIWTRSLLTISK